MSTHSSLSPPAQSLSTLHSCALFATVSASVFLHLRVKQYLLSWSRPSWSSVLTRLMSLFGSPASHLPSRHIFDVQKPRQTPRLGAFTVSVAAAVGTFVRLPACCPSCVHSQPVAQPAPSNEPS